MSLRIFILFLIVVVIPLGAAFEVSPPNPNPGEEVTITGAADPGEMVRLRSSFEMNLPVENGKYEYVANGVEIPKKPNRFSVVARNVETLTVGVKMGIWVTMPVKASGGIASVSKSDVPSGRYTLKMLGDALPGATAVSIRVDAETAVRADSSGDYELVMDTSGVPEGEYKIRVGGEEVVISIGRVPAAPSRSGSKPSGTSSGVTTSPKTADEERRAEADLISIAIPDPYYKEMKRADAENLDEIVRYVSTVRNRVIFLDVFERAAFYEYYLTGCGFNVSFAYSENFDNASQDHLWLLVTTRKGEVIEVDPSYRDAGGSSILPLDPEYSRYDQRFLDIYDASESLGVERLAWWTDEIAWGSPLVEACQSGEEAVNVSTASIEEKGLVFRIRDLFMRAFGKIAS